MANRYVRRWRRRNSHSNEVIKHVLRYNYFVGSIRLLFKSSAIEEMAHWRPRCSVCVSVLHEGNWGNIKRNHIQSTRHYAKIIQFFIRSTHSHDRFTQLRNGFPSSDSTSNENCVGFSNLLRRRRKNAGVNGEAFICKLSVWLGALNCHIIGIKSIRRLRLLLVSWLVWKIRSIKVIDVSFSACMRAHARP